MTKADRPDRPDRLIFDLDPSDDEFGKVQEVAAGLRDRLDGLDIVSFVQVTGSRGLHIVLPLRRTADFDTLRPAMRTFADTLAKAMPKIATTAQRKRDRGDRVLVDTFRTAPGQTFVAPYAVRARPGAPVATPLRWSEALAADMTPDRYRIDTIGKRLAQMEDPWADIDEAQADARTVAKKLSGDL